MPPLRTKACHRLPSPHLTRQSCAIGVSGIGLSFTLSASWGVDRGEEPLLMPTGNSRESLAKRFTFYYESVNFNTYRVYLVISGWYVTHTALPPTPLHTRHGILLHTRRHVRLMRNL